jgi:cytoskeletal protein RodZ
MLIALVGTLAFGAVWFVLLRPKSITPEPTASPGASAPASDPSSSGSTPITDRPAQAQAAADAASQQAEGAAAADAAGSGAATTSSPAAGSAADSASSAAAGTAPAPDASASSASSAASGSGAPKITFAKGMPAGERAVLRQLASGKTVVMLFWSPKGADDRQARRAVREASRGRSKVAVRLVPIKDVGAYESITGGVTITQSPTTMIIGPERKAVTITGLVDPLEIEQAIGRLAPAKG